MVEVGILFKLLPVSIWDMYRAFEHIDMLSIGLWQQQYSVIPSVLCSDFGDLGHLWSQNDVIRSWLRLSSYWNCFMHPYKSYTMCLSTLICCRKVCGSSLTQLYRPYFAYILVIWVTCGVKMMSLDHGWGIYLIQTASCIHIRHVKSVWAHWYAVHRHALSALHSYTQPTWLRFWV